MPSPANLVHQTTTGTGTGNLTLSAVNGKQSFATAFSTGVTTNVFDYFISNRDAAEYERGTGHMSDATTLVRDTVTESTNSNAAVSFSAGTKDVTNDVPAGSRREVLIANRTYYVRTDGSDSNNGLANTSGGAFLTIQKAVDTAATLDVGGYTVTIQVGDGTYTGVVSLKNVAGFSAAGTLIIQGNNSTPANVLISTSATAFTADALNVIWDIKDLKITTSAADGIWAARGGKIRFGNLDFGAISGSGILASDGGTVVAVGNYSITGNATRHIQSTTLGIVRTQSITITLTGTPAFSVATVTSSYGANATVQGATYSGSATGVRYSATMNGTIFSNGGANHIPGDSAGTTATGGQYA